MSNVTITATEQDISFAVDQESCTKCGLCAKDCPFGIISLEPGYPLLTSGETCIRCQHCFTVCPTVSLSILGLSPEAGLPLKNSFPSKEQMTSINQGEKVCKTIQRREPPGRGNRRTARDHLVRTYRPQ